MLRIAVITISDRASRGEYEDRSGPAIREILIQLLPGADIRMAIVPDERERIHEALENHLDSDYILTAGGTGISPRDVTPEVTASVCERELPGISEWLRRESHHETPYAVFSRAYSGVRGRTIIVNFPGSVKGASLCARLLAPVMAHGPEMIRGGGH